MRWFLLASIACAGCDVVFGLQRKPGEDVPDGGKDGAGGGDAMQPLCGTPVLEDSFDDGGSPCGTWGGPTEIGASLVETSGDLVISLQPGADTAFGGCTHHSVLPFNAGGLELHVPAVVTVPGAYVVLHAYAADPDTQVDASIAFQGSTLALFVGAERFPRAMRTYAASEMQYWRLRPAPDGKSVFAEYSADGEVYTLLGTAAGTPPTAVKLNFGAGASALTTATEMRVAHVRVCGP